MSGALPLRHSSRFQNKNHTNDHRSHCCVHIQTLWWKSSWHTNIWCIRNKLMLNGMKTQHFRANKAINGAISSYLRKSTVSTSFTKWERKKSSTTQLTHRCIITPFTEERKKTHCGNRGVFQTQLTVSLNNSVSWNCPALKPRRMMRWAEWKDGHDFMCSLTCMQRATNPSFMVCLLLRESFLSGRVAIFPVQIYS